MQMIGKTNKSSKKKNWMQANFVISQTVVVHRDVAKGGLSWKS